MLSICCQEINFNRKLFQFIYQLGFQLLTCFEVDSVNILRLPMVLANLLSAVHRERNGNSTTNLIADSI